MAVDPLKNKKMLDKSTKVDIFLTTTITQKVGQVYEQQVMVAVGETCRSDHYSVGAGDGDGGPAAQMGSSLAQSFRSLPNRFTNVRFSPIRAQHLLG
jgi:hypothetical protein